LERASCCSSAPTAREGIDRLLGDFNRVACSPPGWRIASATFLIASAVALAMATTAAASPWALLISA